MLKIYNITGQEICLLLDNDMTAGIHYVQWDGTDNSGKRVASGIYIYQISTGKIKQARKMTLAF